MKAVLLRYSWLALATCLAAVEPSHPTSPTIILVGGEPEYQSTNTLPAFQRYLETNFAFHCLCLRTRSSNDDIPGLQALEKADLLILFVRRTTLPEEQLSRFRKYLDAGKPLIGLRTASHAFQTWKEFDHEVLGGNYHNHYGNQLPATAKINSEMADHPILKKVAPEFLTAGSLYKTSPLGSNTTLLVTGSVANEPPEPIAWTHTYRGARVFYTSLGHPKDFENPAFRQMLVNAVFWALNLSAPPKVEK